MKTCRKSRSSKLVFRILVATPVPALCIFTAAGATNAAAVVTLTDSSPQTVDGQDFSFTFSPVPLSDETDGTLAIHARGDYDGPGSVSGPDEFLTWDIDGLLTGTASPYLGSPIIADFGSNDCEWEDSFAVSGTLLTTITSDSLVTISVDLASAVNLGWDSNQFVEVRLSYVPEPGTALLFGLGSLPLLRRRNA